jgi:hypothetical protein
MLIVRLICLLVFVQYHVTLQLNLVPKQCGRSGMLIPDPGSRTPDPDFYPSRIPDPGSRTPDPGPRIQKQQQKGEVKNLVVIPFYVATNYTKL